MSHYAVFSSSLAAHALISIPGPEGGRRPALMEIPKQFLSRPHISTVDRQGPMAFYFALDVETGPLVSQKA